MSIVAQIKQTHQAPPAAASVAMQQDQQQCTPVMTLHVQIQYRLARIAISGRFDSQTRRNFSHSYLPLLDNADVHEIWVDMSKVNYMDSSAMGMLLLLKDRAQAVNKPVTLLTIPGVVAQILEVTHFSKIFNIQRIGSGNNGLPGLFHIGNSVPVAS